MKMTKRGERALELLRDGAFFHVCHRRDRFGVQTKAHELHMTIDGKNKVKGFGSSTMWELREYLDKQPNGTQYDFGVYRLAQI